MMDLSGLRKYRRLDEMLADPDIDLVDICNPTHLHPEAAIAALQAGKHVLVEKAIALETRDADAMVEAAHKAGRLLMVAHVLPFFPEFAYAARAIRLGEFGKVLGGHFKRVISRPDWSADIGDAARPAGPRSICTSTIPISSAWPAACRSTSSRSAAARVARLHI